MKMQLPVIKSKFNSKKVEEFLKNENKFITELFSITSIPDRKGKFSIYCLDIITKSQTSLRPN